MGIQGTTCITQRVGMGRRVGWVGDTVGLVLLHVLIIILLGGLGLLFFWGWGLDWLELSKVAACGVPLGGLELGRSGSGGTEHPLAAFPRLLDSDTMAGSGCSSSGGGGWIGLNWAR